MFGTDEEIEAKERAQEKPAQPQQASPDASVHSDAPTAKERVQEKRAQRVAAQQSGSAVTIHSIDEDWWKEAANILDMTIAVPEDIEDLKVLVHERLRNDPAQMVKLGARPEALLELLRKPKQAQLG